MLDVLDELKELHKQAVTKHSHYAANCCQRAIQEIETLRKRIGILGDAYAWAQLNNKVSKQEMPIQ